MLSLFAAAFLLFAAGLVHLFELRIERGDVRPPYSSFRADPLGVRAFYVALGEQPGVTVERNLGPISGLTKGRRVSLFLCGMPVYGVDEDTAGALENFAANGGRLVITFFPTSWEDWEAWHRSVVPLSESDEEDEQGQPSGEPQEEDKTGPESNEGGEQKESARKEAIKEARREQEFWMGRAVSLEKRWGFAFGFKKLPGTTLDQMGATRVRKNAGPDDLPPSLSWHSTLWFDKCAPEWQIVYSRDDFPVLMQRAWGSGSIVLSSDSYFLSNEAVHDEAQPALLAWLVGPSNAAIFDETHLGIQESPGVAALLEKYRLQGVLAALAFVAGLLVWRNVASLVPKRAVQQASGVVSEGKGAAEGLVNLLRRSVPSGKVLAVCHEEWERSFSRDPTISAKKREQIRQVVAGETARSRKDRDSVQAYRSICAILKERG